MTLCSADLEVLVSEKYSTTIISLNWKLRLPFSHFGFLMPLNQMAKKGVTVLAGVIDPDYQKEIELLFHNGGKEEYI